MLIDLKLGKLTHEDVGQMDSYIRMWDVLYKNEDDNPTLNHLYQIRTYVDEYDRNHTHKVDGMLLYAKTQEDDLEDAQITHREGYTLYVRTLDLNTDFEAIKNRLNSFIAMKK